MTRKRLEQIKRELERMEKWGWIGQTEERLIKALREIVDAYEKLKEKNDG